MKKAFALAVAAGLILWHRSKVRRAIEFGRGVGFREGREVGAWEGHQAGYAEALDLQADARLELARCAE